MLLDSLRLPSLHTPPLMYSRDLKRVMAAKYFYPHSHFSAQAPNPIASQGQVQDTGFLMEANSESI